MLEVSLETSDKGRGMNSKVSENPTLALAVGLAVGFTSSTDDFREEFVVSGEEVSTGREMVEFSAESVTAFMSGKE